jgi:branched-chain amino acid transport system permease protein
MCRQIVMARLDQAITLAMMLMPMARSSRAMTRSDCRMFDIYLLEAAINGILLGGVLALLALGLNLIFGVIDVVWICYAELVMMGMYGMFYMVSVFHLPFLVAAVLAIALVAVMGVLLHLIVIAPLLNAPPINQLLATGGVLAFLQALATVLFGIDFRNLGIRMPVIEVSDMYISYARLLAFGTALAGMVAVYLFLSRTYTGTAIRAIAQDRQIMPLMGVDTRRIYIVTSAIGGGLAGLAACLLVLQYDVHPFIGLTFGPITFMICVLGGLGNMIGGFVAAFVFAEIISISGLYMDLEWGYVFAFVFFIAMMFVRPRGLLARRT